MAYFNYPDMQPVQMVHEISNYVGGNFLILLLERQNNQGLDSTLADLLFSNGKVPVTEDSLRCSNPEMFMVRMQIKDHRLQLL